MKFLDKANGAEAQPAEKARRKDREARKETNMNKRKGSLTRRRFATIGVVAGLLPIPLVMGSRQASAGQLPRLDEGERSARALSYVHDASRIDSATRGGADRNCRGCRFFTDAGATWGPCTLFPGKAVNADGWCRGWVARES